MALRLFDGTVQYAVDDATGELHIVSVAGDGTATDIVTLATPVSGVTFDADIDIGDVHLLDTADSQVDPANAANQATANASLAELCGDGLTFARKALAASGSTVIVAAAAGKVARVHGLSLVCSEAATLTITDSDDAALYTLGSFAANGGIVLDPVAMAKLAYAETASGKGLKLAVSAGTVDGYVLYSQEG